MRHILVAISMGVSLLVSVPHAASADAVDAYAEFLRTAAKLVPTSQCIADNEEYQRALLGHEFHGGPPPRGQIRECDAAALEQQLFDQFLKLPPPEWAIAWATIEDHAKKVLLRKAVGTEFEEVISKLMEAEESHGFWKKLFGAK